MSVEYVLEGQVARLTIRRASVRNAIDGETLDLLLDGLGRAEREARVIVLTGEGERVFCAGADLSAVAANPERRAQAISRYAVLLERIYAADRPVIARMAGHCLGGGVGLLLACDLAVAADHTTVSLPEAAVGMWPMMVGALLVRDLPRKVALELAMSGRKLTAGEAMGLGLVNRSAPAGQLDEALDGLVGAVLRQSPTALRLGRRAWREAEVTPVGKALPALAAALSSLSETEDAQEGLSAFFEKRPPLWKDR